MGYYDECLEHHGILGQKWGVRRFESANGHLTAAGKNRYDGDKVTEKEKNAFSAKAAGYKVLAAAHTVNSKTAIGKKNRQIYAGAAKIANKQAEKAQKEANEKKANRTPEEIAAAEKRKKMIIAGAAVAGTALAAYGGYKLYQLNKQANSDTLSSQKSLQKVKQQYQKDNSDWKRKTARLNEDRSFYERMGDSAKVAKIDKKLASSPPPLPVSASKKGIQATNNLAFDASLLAKSVTAEGPKSFKTTQNSSKVVSDMTAQKLASASRTINSGSKSVSSTLKVSGQQKFSQASKANDDLVSDLLKKNASMLSGF